MTDLVEFIEGRLADDERVARAAGGDNWIDRNGEVVSAALANGDYGPDGYWVASASFACEGEADGLREGHPEHIARHDPARVLREVEAKRRILREHQPLTPEHEVITGCSSCSWRDDWEELHVAYPCATVQLLAAPFTDHPDFRTEWSPS